MSLTFDAIRRLLLAAIVAGAAAGSVLFVIQQVTIEPLIQQAEAFEHGSAEAHDAHADDTWAPADGVERTLYTAIGTLLTGIAFAAIALGVASALGVPLNLRRGVAAGLFGFACFVLAPSVGLPPKPPGVAGPNLVAAQMWWVMAVTLSAIGCWLIVRPDASRCGVATGVLVLALPHLVGAPAAVPSTVVPAELVTRFAWVSIATRLPFWLLLGAIGGHLTRPIPPSPLERG